MKLKREPGFFSNAAGMAEIEGRDEPWKVVLTDITRLQLSDGCTDRLEVKCGFFVRTDV
jgi:hypothetical protein